MRFEKKEIRLKDGRTCTLRPAVPDDAPALIEYLKIVSGETPFLLRYPDEWTLTEEKERALLESLLQSETSVMMTAEVEGVIAGNASINPAGGARKLRHRGSLGIALKKAYWGLGIGRAALEYLTDLSRRMGYEQIDLEVAQGNSRARSLYAACGFVETGKRLRALKQDDGGYQDEILMVKML